MLAWLAASLLDACALRAVHHAEGTPVRGAIHVNTTWSAARSPYVMTHDVTVDGGVTLVIEPGVTVLANDGVRLTVEGRLLAEGTAEQHIRFTRNAGARSWAAIDFGPGPDESRLAYVDMEHAGSGGAPNLSANGTALALDHVVWRDTTSQLLHLLDTSVILRHSVLPTIRDHEPIRFTGMPAGGHAIIEGNTFGTTTGYNDIIDFTGGKRPGPIGQFLDNVFTGGADDVLDLDGTDAHIEGNVFMHVHQDAVRRSSSNAIATGRKEKRSSDVTICRNIFYDCDHVVLLKGGATAVLQNNTIVGIAANPLASEPPAVINFAEHRHPGGRSAIVDGNIVWDVAGNEMALNFDRATMTLQVYHTIFPTTLAGGIGNVSSDPLFVSVDHVTDVREAFRLRPGSPAIGTGPNGLDMGALVPAGASISGEPASPTDRTEAVLRIGGPGIVAFRYRVNDGPYSAETPIADLLAGETVRLSNLRDGRYTVYVVGKNSAGVYQCLDTPTVSRTWTVRHRPRGRRRA